MLLPQTIYTACIKFKMQFTTLTRQHFTKQQNFIYLFDIVVAWPIYCLLRKRRINFISFNHTSLFCLFCCFYQMAQESISDVIIKTAITTGFSIFAAWFLIKKLNVFESLDPTAAQKKRAKLLVSYKWKFVFL